MEKAKGNAAWSGYGGVGRAENSLRKCGIRKSSCRVRKVISQVLLNASSSENTAVIKQERGERPGAYLEQNKKEEKRVARHYFIRRGDQRARIEGPGYLGGEERNI